MYQLTIVRPDKNLIQSRSPKEGIEKVGTRTLALRKKKKQGREGGRGGGGNAEGLTHPNLNWLHLELAVVRDCESAERVSNCQKKKFQIFKNVDLVSHFV